MPGCVVWCRLPCIFFLLREAGTVQLLQKKKNIVLWGVGNPWQVPQVEEDPPKCLPYAREKVTGRTCVQPHLDPRIWAHEEMV